MEHSEYIKTSDDKNPYAKNYVLKNSWHYYYPKEDFLFLSEKIKEILK